jgi:hypothetical protein
MRGVKAIVFEEIGKEECWEGDRLKPMLQGKEVASGE